MFEVTDEEIGNQKPGEPTNENQKEIEMPDQMELLSLPSELLESICFYLDMQSLCSISQVCWRLNNIQESETVWKTAFFKRYPRLEQGSHQPELQLALKQSGDRWKQLAAWHVSLGAEICAMLDEMGNKYFTIGGLPDPAMQEMKELVSRHCTVLVKDQLLDVLDTEQTDGFEHISRRHYARMLYRELHRDGVLLPLFREFMQRPSEHVNIPEATHLIDQWITPERRRRNASELQHHYQHIAALCLRQLRAAAPHHPAAAWARCKADPFGQTLWSEADVLVVLDAVNAVLYDQLDLLGDQDGRPRTGYAAVAHQLFCGVDAGDVNPRALLSALYATVAGLLGVNMFPVRFPGNSLLRWQTRDGSDSLFVSVMRAGLRQTRDEIMANPYLRIRNVGHESFEPIPRHELLNRLVVGIMAGHRTAHLTDADLLSLNALAVWSETDCRLGFPLLHELSEVFGGIRPMYIHDLTQEFLEQHDGTLSEEEREGLRDSKELMKQRYEQILQELRRHKEVVCLRRNAAPVQRRFRVGDIVRHRRYHYHAVVAGWTERCDATEGWIEQMGVDRLPLGRHQPFFNVLAEDRTTRYAADENLELAPAPLPIGHRELGRYFVRYDGRRYVPLAAVSERYPDPPPPDAEDGDGAAATAAGRGDSGDSGDGPPPGTDGDGSDGDVRLCRSDGDVRL
ncbi:F-box only protein 21-like [Amphibalanus amphitrite]|uniref:F-box only protein 21-like n=1 Tax=Amphibalanus amphitrite TaxID=1232801 RepID=UPI001C90EA16|nr:F-box only protein 21-like [Amphibalanus amphitrite]